jgi:hypothetical protein
MGLKFERTDNLDDMFAKFAIDPDKLDNPEENIDLEEKANVRKVQEGLTLPKMHDKVDIERQKEMDEQYRKEHRILK